MTRMAESGTAASKPRRRRTQQERRAATRAALLDATIECLVEYGYAGVTTTKIVEHAGVSRGAQVHHFPTKAQLVADAVLRLADRMARQIADDLARVPSGGRRLDAVLDLLWEAHSGPLGQAALDQFTRVLAAEVEPRGIRSTTVHMPLVRTPMIKPTSAYDRLPTLTPDAAAEWVCEAIRARPRQVDLPLALVGELTDAVAPGLLRRAMSLVYRAGAS